LPRDLPDALMLFDHIIGNAIDDPDRFAGLAHDPLELTWRECTRRALRGRTAAGREIGVVLPPGTNLRHGDVLAGDGGAAVVVAVTPCEVWVADFDGPTALAAAALELGNLHVPVGVGHAFSLVTVPDGPTRGVFEKYACSWRAETRQFQPLRATVMGAAVQLSPTFKRVSVPAEPPHPPGPDPKTNAPRPSQLTNSRL
jgi:urease accessory protein UreE